MIVSTPTKDARTNVIIKWGSDLLQTRVYPHHKEVFIQTALKNKILELVKNRENAFKHGKAYTVTVRNSSDKIRYYLSETQKITLTQFAGRIHNCIPHLKNLLPASTESKNYTPLMQKIMDLDLWAHTINQLAVIKSRKVS